MGSSDLVTISGWTSDGLGDSTCTNYDSLSRVTSVTPPDGNVVTTSYSGNVSTVADSEA